MSKLKSLWQRFKVRCRPLIPWVRYAYFLRFSILLWVFPPLLVGLNCASAPRALISGIVTPTRWVQYLCVTFFLIASSFVSLILARIVIVNGKERFDEEPPERLTKLFADPKARHEWIAPIASLANTAGVLVYFFVNGVAEHVEWQQIAVGPKPRNLVSGRPRRGRCCFREAGCC
jgi:putative exporter of polyketide antibiotics